MEIVHSVAQVFTAKSHNVHPQEQQQEFLTMGSQNRGYVSLLIQSVTHVDLSPTEFDKLLLADQMEVVHALASKGGKKTKKNRRQTYAEFRDMDWLGMSPVEQMAAFLLSKFDHLTRGHTT